MRIHNKHVLMCTGPRCTENGAQAEVIFKKLGEYIDARPDLKVKRTRTHCFAICKNGPVLVVYPDGVWYNEVDENALERIVSEHLANGNEVKELLFHRVIEGDVCPATGQ